MVTEYISGMSLVTIVAVVCGFGLRASGNGGMFGNMHVAQSRSFALCRRTICILLVLAAALVAVITHHGPDTATGAADAPVVSPAEAFAVLGDASGSAGEIAALARARGVLEREGDALPRDFRRVDTAVLIGRLGASDEYLAAGPLTVCLVTAPAGAVRGQSVACSRAPEATGGDRPLGAVSATTNGQHVEFVLPDGVRDVRLVEEGGAVVAAAVRRNLAAATLDRPAVALRWTTADGVAHTLPLTPDDQGREGP